MNYLVPAGLQGNENKFYGLSGVFQVAVSVGTTVPGAPTGLVATASGAARINLTWTAPGSTGGAPITGYRIEESPDGTGNWTELVANTTATTYAHTGLAAGTTRHYRVSAINTNGAGTPSNVDDATTATTVPGAPTGLSATASGNTRIDLSWTAPASTGGTAITGYRIEESPNGNSNWTELVGTTGNPATTYSHTGLAAGTIRHYRVSAINANGTGTPSNVDGATTAGTAEVPANWSLKPAGLAAGAKFRLLFLSSTKRDARATDIAEYNTFVQELAAAGHTAIRAYSGGFGVVGCTEAVDARDNTLTTYTNDDKGVAIYWLGGAKAADDYEDFYDGSWDDEANDKNESGADAHDTSQTGNYPNTGCNHDGTEAENNLNASRALGADFIRYGRPNSSGSGHGPLSTNSGSTAKGNTRPLYGLSAVFQVAADTVTEVPANWGLKPAGLAAGAKFRLLFLSSTKRNATVHRHRGLQHLRPDPRRGRPRQHPGLQHALQGGRLHRRHRRPRQHLHHAHRVRQGRAHLLAQRRQGRRRLRGFLRRGLGRRGQRQERVRHRRARYLPSRQRPLDRLHPRRHRGD